MKRKALYDNDCRSQIQRLNFCCEKLDLDQVYETDVST